MTTKTKALISRQKISARPSAQIKDLSALVPIEVSARHIHLSQKDLEALFGKGYQLKKLKQLTQPCDFAAEEKLSIKVADRIIDNVRIVGPVRKQTQIEISLTDAFNLGIQPPLRVSGDVKGSSSATIIGPNAEINLKEGLIIAKRHLHCATNEAEELKLKNDSIVSILVKGPREITFYDVKVRTKDDYKLCLHLDTDEGNAAGITRFGEGHLIK